jgi:antitoxin ParD1/3/4
MPSKYALSVSLTEHLCKFVDEQVEAGRYRTASEVVRAALRLLESGQATEPQPARSAKSASASASAENGRSKRTGGANGNAKNPSSRRTV